MSIGTSEGNRQLILVGCQIVALTHACRVFPPPILFPTGAQSNIGYTLFSPRL